MVPSVFLFTCSPRMMVPVSFPLIRGQGSMVPDSFHLISGQGIILPVDLRVIQPVFQHVHIDGFYIVEGDRVITAAHLALQIKHIHQWWIQDFPDGGGGANFQGGGTNLLNCQNFTKNCMKMKEFGP